MEINYTQAEEQEQAFEFSLDDIKTLEGTYQGTITKIEVYQNVATAKGMKNRVTFTFALTVDDKLVEQEQTFYMENYPTSRYVQFMKMLCTEFNTNKISNDVLINKPIAVTFKRNIDPRDSEKIYSNVVGIKQL